MKSDCFSPDSTRFGRLAGLGLFAVLTALPAVAPAAPLNETTAVQTRPDPTAPVVTYLKAGAEPVPAADIAAPDGWMAVQVPGPFEGYVRNQDLNKSLDVRPGSALYLQPQPDAVVIETVAKGDKTTITGLHGKWTQVRLDKSIVGYIHVLGSVATGPDHPSVPASAPAVSSPDTSAAVGRPAPGFASVDTNTLPRFFDGTFVSTHNLLPLHRPYDWQLIDGDGSRRAYLDVSKLLLTDQIERYVNRSVNVFGTMKSLPDGKNLVITVESLQLK